MDFKVSALSFHAANGIPGGHLLHIRYIVGSALDSIALAAGLPRFRCETWMGDIKNTLALDMILIIISTRSM